MTGTRPAKLWRVDGPADRNGGEQFRSKSAAYDVVAELTGFGHTAKVYHWAATSLPSVPSVPQGGEWRLYEVIEAPAEAKA
jgi:hypothetical protein